MTNLRRLSIFPLTGTILLPGQNLPLHFFEPRYRAMVSDCLARDRQIGIIQPQQQSGDGSLFKMGCVGRITKVEALEDGCYNVVLAGVCRFHVVNELKVSTLFRQVEAKFLEEDIVPSLAPIERAAFEEEARNFADIQRLAVDWDMVERLDDAGLIDGVAMAAPFDPASKQALLEAATLSERTALLIQLMQFYAQRSGAGQPIVETTLQ